MLTAQRLVVPLASLQVVAVEVALRLDSDIKEILLVGRHVFGSNYSRGCSDMNLCSTHNVFEFLSSVIVCGI